MNLTTHTLQFNRRAPTRQRQSGIVVYIALIALVVLTLAALGFMRSVDTSKILAGNLAFNRAAIAISDAGMEAGRSTIAGLDDPAATSACSLTDAGASCLWLDGVNMTSLPSALRPPTNGYWAAVDPTFDYRTTDWAHAYQVSGLNFTETASTTGYDIRYIVHRMCEQAGNPISARCLTASALGGQSNGSISALNNQQQSVTSNPVYRITVRVAGPRNSLSYLQIWMS